MAEGAGGGEDILPPAAAVALAPAAPAPPAGPPTRGRLTVWVEDVARADAAARPLGRAEADAALGPGAAVPFAVRGPAPPPGARAAVRAHLDVDGDGQVSAGDWVTTEHVAAGARVRLVLHPVA